MSAESKQKIIGVALGVCIVCSILVSTAAVSLNAIQQRNKKLDKIKNYLGIGILSQAGHPDRDRPAPLARPGTGQSR